MSRRIAIIDTYYPDAIRALPVDKSSGYDAELRKVLQASFGTADFYSAGFRDCGWTALDIVANHCDLQSMWCATELPCQEIVLDQIATFKPDVLFMQDLSLFSPETLHDLAQKYLLVGQCSCPMPHEARVREFRALFTSFPHYVERFEQLGVEAYYMPLAFDPIVLVRAEQTKDRIHDCVFVGGVGTPSHWRYGMSVLEGAASNIPTFKWWGYGAELLPASSPLRNCYQGPAFGLDMYRVLLQSKIVLNRHGEVAAGYSNNMRMYEATGCGALLVTEYGKNLDSLFTQDEVAAYRSPADAVIQIQHYLSHRSEREDKAAAGQRRTLMEHSYNKRMKAISEILETYL